MDAKVLIFMSGDPIRFFMHAKTDEDLYMQLPKFMKDKYGKLFNVDVNPVTDAKPFAEIHYNKDHRPVATVGYETLPYSTSPIGKAIYTSWVCGDDEEPFDVLAKIYRAMIEEYDKNDLFYAKIKTGKG